MTRKWLSGVPAVEAWTRDDDGMDDLPPVPRARRAPTPPSPSLLGGCQARTATGTICGRPITRVEHGTCGSHDPSPEAVAMRVEKMRVARKARPPTPPRVKAARPPATGRRAFPCEVCLQCSARLNNSPDLLCQACTRAGLRALGDVDVVALEGALHLLFLGGTYVGLALSVDHHDASVPDVVLTSLSDTAALQALRRLNKRPRLSTTTTATTHA